MKLRIGSLQHFLFCHISHFSSLPLYSTPPGKHAQGCVIHQRPARRRCVLHFVAGCDSVLQCFAMCCSVFKCADQRRVRRTMCVMTHDASCISATLLIRVPTTNFVTDPKTGSASRCSRLDLTMSFISFSRGQSEPFTKTPDILEPLGKCS